MSATYLLFNLCIVLLPVSMAIFPWRYHWTKKEWQQLVRVYLFVSLPFVVLDSFSHARGWWAYNESYILGVRLFGLPLEELLFFFTVPFACVYLFTLFAKHMRYSFKTLPPLAALVLMAGALTLLYFSPVERTAADVFLFLFLVVVFTLRLPSPVLPLWWLAVCILFVLFNGFLTRLPVVTYNPVFGSVFRLGTIPLEDFFYNASLLQLSLAVFFNGTNHQLGAD